jgi:Catalytic LigB subunit of aromatic ring-opening dioxygenase
MPISFACAVSHAPGMTAWANAAASAQKDRIYGGFERLRGELDSSGTEILVLLTSEHWANFFLDHMGAFCIGRAASYRGPIEPWLQIDKAEVKGDPALAAELLETSYDEGIEPSFADPQPTARRCLAFGQVIGQVAARSPHRIGLIATGGLSHDPGERNHGVIDTDFDQQFMSVMASGNTERLGRYSRAELAAAGAGAFELLSWVALAGALAGRKGETVVYEAVKPWATGIGMVSFAQAIAA